MGEPAGGKPAGGSAALGIPDAPVDGTIYGRKDAGWVAVPGGGAQTPYWVHYSRSGNTNPGAPIGAAGGNNASPGFVVPVASTITAWTMSYRSGTAATAGLEIVIDDPGWTRSTVPVSKLADADPTSDNKRTSDTVAIAVPAGSTVIVRSNASAAINRVTVGLELLPT